MGIEAIVLIVLGVILLLAILGTVWWLVSTYNFIISRRSNVEDAFESLDSLLKKRYADISIFIETFGKHCDVVTREQVLNARNDAMASASIAEQLKNEALLELGLNKLLAQIEAQKANFDDKTLEIYSNLCKNQDFINHNRQFYNGLASAYNIKISSIPGLWVAKMCHLEPKELFIIQAEESAKNSNQAAAD